MATSSAPNASKSLTTGASPYPADFKSRPPEQRASFATGRLALAAQEGSLPDLHFALQNGASAKAFSENMDTALMIAARYGRVECVEALLPVSDANASQIDRRSDVSMTALGIAAENGHTEVVCLMLNKARGQMSEETIETAREIAFAMGEHNDFDYGDCAVAFARDRLPGASKREEWAVLLRSAFRNDAVDLLRAAIGVLGVSELNDIVENESDAGSACHWAAHANASECLGVLLETGFHPEAVDDAGRTPLMVAAQMNSNDALRRLANVADVDTQSKAIKKATPAKAGGHTALSFAILETNVEAARTLLAAGANPNIAAATGETPLMLAVRMKTEPGVRLLAPVSDLSVKGKDGKTAVELAVDTENWACVDAFAGILSPQEAEALIFEMAMARLPQLSALAQANALRREVERGQAAGAARRNGEKPFSGAEIEATAPLGKKSPRL